MTRCTGPRARYNSNYRIPLSAFDSETSQDSSQYSSRLAYTPSTSSHQYSLKPSSRGRSRTRSHSHSYCPAYRLPYKLEEPYDEGYDDALHSMSRASFIDPALDPFPDALPLPVQDLLPFCTLRSMVLPPGPLRYGAPLPLPPMRGLSRAGPVAIPIPVPVPAPFPVPIPIFSRDEADYLDQVQGDRYRTPSASETDLDSYASTTSSSGTLTPIPSICSDSRSRVFNWATCGSESGCTEEDVELESLDHYEARRDGSPIRTRSNSCKAFSDRNLGRVLYHDLLGLNTDGCLSHPSDYHNLLGLTPSHSTGFSAPPTAASMIKDLKAERDRLLKTARAYEILVKKQVEKERRELNERTEVLDRVEAELEKVQIEEEAIEREIAEKKEVEGDLKGKGNEKEKEKTEEKEKREDWEHIQV